MRSPFAAGKRRASGRKTGGGAAGLEPGLPSLKEWFRRSDLPLTQRQYEQLWRYHKLLRDKNREYDLTRIHQFDSMVQKHYIDCVLVARLLDWRIPSPILDIGTGAGLPGIPLKVVCPDTHFILSEGRHKRVQFLHEVMEALALQGIEILGKKIYPTFQRPVHAVITRALETIPKTLSRIRGCLVLKGKAIFMKGPNCDEEVRQALEDFRGAYRLLQDISYTIPHTPHRRRLVIFERLVI
ncbi:MAG: 16S rRNA (guanine(527)-N(7))-methyltransferase RsmG [Deltaproteobacteria bacterium]|nr:16S rRNA (guanine(527)-N(7))-methyltransferase RsmG [Deltaproteobacteria bacterium]